jgi:hypothetical protein
MKGGGKKRSGKAKAKAAAADKTKWQEESKETKEAIDTGAGCDSAWPDDSIYTAIPRMQHNLSEFWRKHGRDFSYYWTRLPDEEKRGFILAGNPYMKEGYAANLHLRYFSSRTSFAA